MIKIELNIILSISKKEFLDRVRNGWFLLLSILFIVMICITSYTFGGWKSFEEIVPEMVRAQVSLIIPILGLMLGYATIWGEKENGSLSLLLAYSPRRYYIIIGKFVGLSMLIFTTMLVGFTLSGIIIAINTGSTGWTSYVVLFLESFILGCAFLSISVLLSTLFKSRSGAMGSVISTWFFLVIIWPAVALILLTTSFSASKSDFPDWFYISNLFNPYTIYNYSVWLTVKSQTSYPWYFNVYSLNLAGLAWISLYLIIAVAIFNRKDI